MRLSSEVLREVLDSLKGVRLNRNFRIGHQLAPVRLPRAPCCARERRCVLPPTPLGTDHGRWHCEV